MYTKDGQIWIATGEMPVMLRPEMANRRGLIAEIQVREKHKP